MVYSFHHFYYWVKGRMDGKGVLACARKLMGE